MKSLEESEFIEQDYVYIPRGILDEITLDALTLFTAICHEAEQIPYKGDRPFESKPLDKGQCLSTDAWGFDAWGLSGASIKSLVDARLIKHEIFQHAPRSRKYHLFTVIDFDKYLKGPYYEEE